MRRTFSTFVATFCLLALFISSAACMALPASQLTPTATHVHSVSAADHECCPAKHSGKQVTAACCTVHHQPAAASSAANHTLSLDATPATLATLLPEATTAPPTSKKTGPPPRRPSTVLRI